MKLHMLCVRLSCAGVVLRSVLVAVLLVGGVSLSSAMTTHYIIAFDQRVPPYTEQYNNPSILDRIDKMLAGQYDGATDYISVVGYAFNTSNPSMEDFVRPYPAADGDVLWCKKGDTTLKELFADWPSRFPQRGNSSLQSLAKPYVVMATRNDSLYADRTIIFLITDEEINGTDDNWVSEWKDLRNKDNYRAMDRIKDSAFSCARRFNECFSFREMADEGDPFHREEISNAYKIVPYELTAADRLSVYVCTDLPSPLPLRRVRGGYKIETTIHSTDPAYSLRELLLTCGSDTLLRATAAAGKVMRINKLIPSRSLSGVDSLTISATVAYDDGQYDGCLLSYRNPTYRKGMSRTWKWEPPSEEKIFGRLPLWDIFWWWYPNDVVKAVMVWDGIFVLLFLIIVVWLFYRCFEWINAYTPKDKNIKITKIE